MKTGKTTAKKATRKRKKVPVKFQVKALKPNGVWAVREFFDNLEKAKSFAQDKKDHNPDYSVKIAAYEKLGVLEPCETIEL